jgi:hypothetical protein
VCVSFQKTALQKTQRNVNILQDHTRKNIPTRINIKRNFTSLAVYANHGIETNAYLHFQAFLRDALNAMKRDSGEYGKIAFNVSAERAMSKYTYSKIFRIWSTRMSLSNLNFGAGRSTQWPLTTILLRLYINKIKTTV